MSDLLIEELKRRGVRFEDPRAALGERIRKALKLRDGRPTVSAPIAAREAGCSRGSVHNWCKRNGVTR